KFKRAVTDSDNRIVFAEDKPGISNLLSIYSAFTGESIEEAEKRFEGKGYGDFKLAVGEAVVDALLPVQKKYAEYLADKAELERIMKDGAEKASRIAERTLQKVKKKIGFIV
ncbi:MAG TPA: tryptophan--tRNA ligase, partial [Clostridiales bacterium]|nr:tryptophan--tRNA ligase [Clostridiales bacterium]